MSLSSVEIKSLPITDEILDSDLIIVEKQNYTAAAPGGLIKNYFINEINEVITANTYSADEVTLTLSAGEFKVKDGGIGLDQLSPDVVAQLGSGTSNALSGVLATYTTPVTSSGKFLEINIDIGGGTLRKYGIRLYELP
jgi:hypothetical protein